MPESSSDETKRLARNKLISRIGILALGFLILLQVGPMIWRMLHHLPA